MESLPSKTNESSRLSRISPSLRHSGALKKTSVPVTTADSGFTLLEILAVLFIIGIIASFAGLSIGQRSSRAAQDEAERLHGLLSVTSEEAILQGRELAVEFTREGYRFLELDNDNQWIPIAEDVHFRERKLPPDVKIELLIEGAAASFDDEKNLPRLFILSSGELTPFELSFSLEDKKTNVLRGSVDGKLELLHASEVASDG